MPGSQPFELRADRLAPMRRLAAAVPPSAILLLLTAVIVGIGLLLVQVTFSQRNARSTAQHEARTMSVLQELHQSLVDAETGQRGYLLTLDPIYLAPYDNARRRIPDELAALREQLASNGDPESDDRLREIEKLAGEKLSELDQTVGYARAGSAEAAIQVVRSNAGIDRMDRLRVNLDTLSSAQRQRREAAFAIADRAEDRQIPLLIGMWVTLILLVWAAVWGESRRVEAMALAGQAVRLHELNERNKLLAQELNHRVKNLFGVVLSLVGLAGREKGSTEVIVGDLSQRIHALARSHSLAFGSTPDAVTELAKLLDGVLEPYRGPSGSRVTLSGDPCGIAAQQITPLALVLHELATNAAKYGALSSAEGRVHIAWSCTQQADGSMRTTMVWREEGGPPPDLALVAAPAGGGFGNRMVDAVLRQIDGTIERQWPGTGALVTLTFRRDDPVRHED
ncbi:two-component sensor histidine kinase [Novosphingobium kunmingense]|uniref:histidine kinase n=1 Tax=Novosphingobium kunmingense TaxID=1211806 RepID=A0A2N0HJR3_9SPHN|nr:CHASE3 domain-containing protein [Novosphingobium kunmingense]PKB19177.1 two-component sensor histidine kinase [Novosphingobium kunmingense]